MRTVIEKLAQLAGIDVDDGWWTCRHRQRGSVAAAGVHPLSQLADGISRSGRLLSARYDQLGGVRGALTRQADAALADVLTAGRRSREQADPDQELLDTIAAEAEHAETTRDAELPYRRRTRGTQPVYGLRLPAERIEQLRRIAEARGVEPSVLARQWVIDQLARVTFRVVDAEVKQWDPATANRSSLRNSASGR